MVHHQRSSSTTEITLKQTSKFQALLPAPSEFCWLHQWLHAKKIPIFVLLMSMEWQQKRHGLACTSELGIAINMVNLNGMSTLQVKALINLLPCSGWTRITSLGKKLISFGLKGNQQKWPSSTLLYWWVMVWIQKERTLVLGLMSQNLAISLVTLVRLPNTPDNLLSTLFILTGIKITLAFQLTLVMDLLLSKILESMPRMEVKSIPLVQCHHGYQMKLWDFYTLIE